MDSKRPSKRSLAKVQKPVSEASSPVITNMVFRGELMQKLNLKMLSEGLGGSFDPNQFPAWQIRNRFPWATLSVHGNGKVVIVGPKTREHAFLAVYIQLMRINTKFDLCLEVHNLGLHNMVTPFTVGFRINLELIIDDYRERAEMDTDDIGALRVYPCGMSVPPMLVLWRSSKGHVAGGVNKNQIQQVYRFLNFEMYREGREYRKLEERHKAQAKPVLVIE